ncbi:MULTISPECIES: autoinducer binding domain-containing protein [Mesorhizobium]|uniref:helix-turn-helix transcriptional regulator n=1 Tax=Mesorhizobium TaxID=68287 RepID=UPI0007EE0D29|nr:MULTISPECIES: autoinducer binding domain-containing protein [Mesorhizobium]
MQNVFEILQEQLSASVDEADFREAMATAISEFDLLAFAYLSLPSQPSDRPRLISNYSVSWTTRYLEKRYDSLDLVIDRARYGGYPFRWGLGFSDFEISHAQQRLFHEAAEFGICCGVTIPIIDPRRNVAAMTFAADERDRSFFRVRESYEEGLRFFATCFHMFVQRKLAVVRTVDGVSLTPREYECLQWAAKGEEFADDLHAMHRLHYRVFKERLDWEVRGGGGYNRFIRRLAAALPAAARRTA